jgi:hypothetical protein
MIRTENIFHALFWLSSGLGAEADDEGYFRAVASLSKCPGISNLQHFRTSSVDSAFQLPLPNVESLTSLDISLKQHPDRELSKVLTQVKNVRLNCSFDYVPSLWSVGRNTDLASVGTTSRDARDVRDSSEWK